MHLHFCVHSLASLPSLCVSAQRYAMKTLNVTNVTLEDCKMHEDTHTLFYYYCLLCDDKKIPQVVQLHFTCTVGIVSFVTFSISIYVQLVFSRVIFTHFKSVRVLISQRLSGGGGENKNDKSKLT